MIGQKINGPASWAFIFLKKKKSVLIGHIFGFSAENMNIPSQYAWIASLFGALALFLSLDSFCEFYFPVAVFLSIYFVFL